MTYGLLGEHLSHSYSPLIHSMLGDYEYRLFEVAPCDIEGFVRSGDFQGLNVTVPYKKTVMPFLDSLSERAERIGSVNVIVRRPDGTLFGDNTDYYGFYCLVKSSRIQIKDKKVLVLGSGGASLAVKAVLSDMEAGSVTVISRSGEDNYENISRHYDADVIVNTTPVGMYPHVDECPRIPYDGLTTEHICYDLLYNPDTTLFMKKSAEAGASVKNGLEMLLLQAFVSWNIWKK